MTLADLLPMLLETTVASTAAILLVLVVRHPLRHAFGAGIAYATWTLVPMAIVAVALPAPALVAMQVPAIATPFPVTLQVEQRGDLVPVVPVIAGGLWLLGVFGSAFRMLAQQRRFMRGLGRIERVDADVLVADAVAGLPAAVGLLRPRVILPIDAARRYDAVEHELMLAHERIHIARGDLVANAVLASLRCLFWFNPLLHMAASRFRHDQELACDQQVLARHPGARRSYGEAMLKTQLAEGLLPLGCHWGQTHPLKERIEMLKQPLPTTRRRAIGRAIATAMLLACGYAAWAAQPGTTSKSPATSKAAHVEPQIQAASPPQYPESAQQEGVEGMVVMVVDLTAEGSVAGARVKKTAGDPRLDAAGLEAVKRWKFNPAIEDGKAVPSQIVVPVSFRLDASDAGNSSGGSDYYVRPGTEKSAGVGSYDRMIASFGEGIWKPVAPSRPANGDDC